MDSGPCLVEKMMETKADEQLRFLLTEFKANGFESELTTSDNRSLVDIARDKMKHPRCKAILQSTDWRQGHRDLSVAGMLGCIIYTGTEAQGDIRRWLRTPMSEQKGRWKQTVDVIRAAVLALREDPPATCYHGLNGVELEANCYRGFAGQYSNLISVAMDYEVGLNFARGLGGTVNDRNSQGLLLHVDTAEFYSIGHWVLADMRLISKFPDETEWLMVPLCFGRGGLGTFKSLPSRADTPGIVHVKMGWGINIG